MINGRKDDFGEGLRREVTPMQGCKDSRGTGSPALQGGLSHRGLSVLECLARTGQTHKYAVYIDMRVKLRIVELEAQSDIRSKRRQTGRRC
jgi:hypothetical protein